MTNETLQTIRSRRSCRAYEPRQITDAELDAVLEAGTYAASAMGRQSAKIVVVQDAATRAQLTRMNAAVMGTDSDPMHGPMWIYVAIAVGMDKAGTESPFMIVQGAGTYGSEDTTENEMIGYANGRIHEMTALLVRRARLEKLHLASIRAGYKYLFVEPGRIGKAKVKEG